MPLYRGKTTSSPLGPDSGSMSRVSPPKQESFCHPTLWQFKALSRGTVGAWPSMRSCTHTSQIPCACTKRTQGPLKPTFSVHSIRERQTHSCCGGLAFVVHKLFSYEAVAVICNGSAPACFLYTPPDCGLPSSEFPKLDKHPCSLIGNCSAHSQFLGRACWKSLLIIRSLPIQ